MRPCILLDIFACACMYTSLQVALPAFGAGAAFANDSPAGGASLLLLASLLALLFMLWREQVQLGSLVYIIGLLLAGLLSLLFMM